MAFIAVNELHANGSALFQDAESFLNELNSGVDTSIYGGNNYSSSTNGVLDYGLKGFEFGAVTFGVDAIGHIVKSFSDHKGIGY
jgi:hypothetical protein